MGKRTQRKGSHFGGDWTIQKLHIIEEYLKVYTTALKKQNVKKIYVDGFAGSGKTELKTKSKAEKESSTVVDGSALLSLKYDFDEYYFMELDPDRLAALEKHVQEQYPDKLGKVHLVTGDCNKKLLTVISQITVYHRCLMFLDPYALELQWETLKKISECAVVDLWYLFPLSAVRLMAKDKDITERNKEKVTSILGTDEWLDALYEESQQISLFEEPQYERIEYTKVLDYIKSRFSTIFSYVSPHSKILKNEAKNAPMFMLCFMIHSTINFTLFTYTFAHPLLFPINHPFNSRWI